MRQSPRLSASLSLAACGGGGGGFSGASRGLAALPACSSPAAVPSRAAVHCRRADLSLADRLYKGDERTPAGFDVEARPASVAGTLSTRHLKNTDFATGPQAAGPTFEVCTNDMAQAIDWSERQATWQGQYSDLVEIRSDTRMFEVVRVPRADATAMIRHRVFRCDYLDRAGTDLRTDSGAAGLMNQRPLNAAELERLGRVPVAVHDVQQLRLRGREQHAPVSGNSLVQTIRMGQLVRGAAGAATLCSSGTGRTP